MRYAAENITSADDSVILMVGVDTCVFHGFVNCGATGAITGIGNVLPREVQHLVSLSKAAAAGDVEARARALELEAALGVLSSFDEGPDLVLFYKHMMVVTGNPEYELHFNETDKLSDSQRGYCEAQLKLFQTWYADWSKQGGAVAKYAA
jgi:4-hydroxy-tetrahydrodipicolinate synthase